jgi:hypothetical protein
LRDRGCEVKGVVGFSKFQVVKVKQEFVGGTLATTRPGGMSTARVN